MKIVLLLASFFVLMFAAYPEKPVAIVRETTVAKPVILHRDCPKPVIYDVFFATEIPAEIPKPTRSAPAHMNHYLNKVTSSTNPSKQQYAALNRNERMH